MKRFLPVLLSILIVLSTITVVSFATFAEETEEPTTVVDEPTTEEPAELPEFPNLKGIPWGSLLLTAVKGIENFAKNVDEPGFNFNEYRLAFAESLKQVMIDGGYEEAWNIIQTNIEKRMGKSWDEKDVSDAAVIVQYIFDYIEYSSGIAVNDLPNLIRRLNLQKTVGKMLNAIITFISTPLTAGTTIVGRISTWFTETVIPFFNSLFGAAR